MVKKIMKVLIKVIIGIVLVIVLGATGLYAMFYSYTQPTTGPQIPNYDNPKTALLVVDIQEDYTGPQAMMPYADGPRIIEATNKLLSRDYSVVYIQSVITHPIAQLVMDGLNAPGSPGIEMDRRLLRVPNAPTFEKIRPDSFINPKLDEYLRSQSVNHVILVGLDGDGCVKSTMQGALNRGYKVTAVMQGIATESGQSLADLSAEYQKLGATVVDML